MNSMFDQATAAPLFKCSPQRANLRSQSSQTSTRTKVCQSLLNAPSSRALLLLRQRREAFAHVTRNPAHQLLFDKLTPDDLGVEGIPRAVRREMKVQVRYATTKDVNVYQFRARLLPQS